MNLSKLDFDKRSELIDSEASKRFSRLSRLSNVAPRFQSNITHSKGHKDDNQPYPFYFNKSEINSYVPEKSKESSNSIARKLTGTIPLNSWSRPVYSVKQDEAPTTNLPKFNFNNSEIDSLQSKKNRNSSLNTMASKRSTKNISSKPDDSKKISENDSKFTKLSEKSKNKVNSFAKSTSLKKPTKMLPSKSSNIIHEESLVQLPNFNCSEIESIVPNKSEQTSSLQPTFASNKLETAIPSKLSSKTTDHSTELNRQKSSNHLMNLFDSEIRSIESNKSKQNSFVKPNETTRLSLKRNGIHEVDKVSLNHLSNLNKSKKEKSIKKKTPKISTSKIKTSKLFSNDNSKESFNHPSNLKNSEIGSFSLATDTRNALTKSKSKIKSFKPNESKLKDSSIKSNQSIEPTTSKALSEADELQDIIENTEEYSMDLSGFNHSEIASIPQFIKSALTNESNKNALEKSSAIDSNKSNSVYRQQNFGKSAIESMHSKKQSTSKKNEQSSKLTNFKGLSDENSICSLNLNESEIVFDKTIDTEKNESTKKAALRRSTKTPSKSLLNITREKDELSKENSISIPNFNDSKITLNESRQNYSIRTRSASKLDNSEKSLINQSGLNESEIVSIEPQSNKRNRSTKFTKSEIPTKKTTSVSFNVTDLPELNEKSNEYSIDLNFNDSEIESNVSKKNCSIRTRSASKAESSREDSTHRSNLDKSIINSPKLNTTNNSKSLKTKASKSSIKENPFSVFDATNPIDNDSVEFENDKEEYSMQLISLSEPKFDSIDMSDEHDSSQKPNESDKFSKISSVTSFNVTASEDTDEENYSISMPNLSESVAQYSEPNFSNVSVSFEPSIINSTGNNLYNSENDLANKERSKIELANKKENDENFEIPKSKKKLKSTGRPIVKKQSKFYETMIDKTPTIIYPQDLQDEEEDQDSLVRRSNRIRVRPLEYWRNQKLKYKLDTDTKCFIVEDVEKGFKPDNPFSKKYARKPHQQEKNSNKRKLKQSKKGSKMPKIKEESSTGDANEISSSEDERVERIKRPRYAAYEESIHQNINESALLTSERIKREATEFYSKSDLIWNPSRHSPGVFISLMNRKKSADAGTQASGFMKMEVKICYYFFNYIILM